MDFKSDVVSVVLVLFFFIFVTWHFPSNRARLLLLYLRIKWPHTLITPMIRNSRTFAVLLSLLAWWAVKILLHIPLWHVSTGFNRNFCIAHNTLCLRSGLCNNFFPISPGCYSRSETNWSPSLCRIWRGANKMHYGQCKSGEWIFNVDIKQNS